MEDSMTETAAAAIPTFPETIAAQYRFNSFVIIGKGCRSCA